MAKIIVALLALSVFTAEASARSSKRFGNRSGLTTSSRQAAPVDFFNVKTFYADQLSYIR